MKKTSKQLKPAAHFAPSELVQPYNPITVNLIGAGGTGGQVLTALARMNHALIALGHAGFCVRVFDADKVEAANLGRQLFTTAELGQHKAVALINRVNRFFGTNWKAETLRYDKGAFHGSDKVAATVTISCVDTVASRFGIGEILADTGRSYHGREHPVYWLDFGNSRQSGQVVLSTLGKVRQPVTGEYRTAERLPLITEEYADLLHTASEDDTPSCSMAGALAKQDLFINSALANCGMSLLWQLIREGMILNRGFFLNLGEFRTQPLKIS